MSNQIIKVTFIMGTRPEIIKLAPLIRNFKVDQFFKVRVILTGQHKEMALDTLNIFDLHVDRNLSLMKQNQSLTYISVATLNGLEIELTSYRPDLVFVQGDTTSAFMGALAAFYQNIDIAHVEAGLRTNDLTNPYPEEANRRLISQISTLHFAPTNLAAKNLNLFGISKNVFTTGNTVIDAMKILLEKKKNLPEFFSSINENDKLILATVHRRENWGKNLLSIVNGIKLIIKNHPDIKFIIPMHRNKNIRKIIENELGIYKKVILTEPLVYDQFVHVLNSAFIILTDSGGIQEEAPSLSKPVLILREKTERQEAIINGTAILVGTNSQNILQKVSKLINDENLYNSMINKNNPFGDGKSSKRILETCKEYFSSKITN